MPGVRQEVLELSMSDKPDDRESIPLFGDDPRYTGRPGPNMVQAKRRSWDNPNICEHSGGLTVCRAERTVECDQCGAMIDPIEAIFIVGAALMRVDWKYEEIRAYRAKERAKSLKEHERRQERKGNGA